MIHAINIPKQFEDKIRELINKGKCNTINEFVLFAIESYLELQKEGIETVIDFEMNNKFSKKIEGKKEPPFDNCLKKEVVNVKCIENPVITDKPVWGQYNRIFPIKLGLRILANMLENNGEKIDLKEFEEKATKVAQHYYRILKDDDKKRGRILGENFTAGLPKKGEKSEHRFQSQYLEWALMELKFTKIEIANEKRKIGITEGGYKFAVLENTIIDKQDFNSTLSKQEIEFFLKYISENLKEEVKHIKILLNAIDNGINTSNSLTSEMKKYYENLPKEKWITKEGKIKDTVANTMRAGLISRLYEMKLIDKKKNGKNVTYLLNEKGMELLSKLNEYKGE